METTLTELLENFIRDRKNHIRTEIKKYGLYDAEFNAEKLELDYTDWIEELVSNFINDQDWDEVKQELDDEISMFS